MLTYLISVVGLLMVIIPQLLSLRMKYLIQLHNPFYPNGPTPYAHDTLNFTILVGYIMQRWDNYAIRKWKKISTILGAFLLITGFGLSFKNEPFYFFLTLNTILCGIVWIILEYQVATYYFKHFRFNRHQFVLMAIFAPFILITVWVILILTFIKIYQVSGYRCEYVDHYFINF